MIEARIDADKRRARPPRQAPPAALIENCLRPQERDRARRDQQRDRQDDADRFQRCDDRQRQHDQQAVMQHLRGQADGAGVLLVEGMDQQVLALQHQKGGCRKRDQSGLDQVALQLIPSMSPNRMWSRWTAEWTFT